MPLCGKTSLSRLEGVSPDLVRLMKEAIKDTPIDFSIDQGVRTAEKQAVYYSWGRTVVNPNTGPIKGNKFGLIVTTCDGYKRKSNHQVKADGYGHAVDIYPYINGKMQFNDISSLNKIAKHIKDVAARLKIKITWGGDWKNPYDPPHFQLG